MHLILGETTDSPGTTLDLSRLARIDREPDPHRYVRPGEPLWRLMGRPEWTHEGGGLPSGWGIVLFRGTEEACRAAKQTLDRFLEAGALEPQAGALALEEPEPRRRGRKAKAG